MNMKKTRRNALKNKVPSDGFICQYLILTSDGEYKCDYLPNEAGVSL